MSYKKNRKIARKNVFLKAVICVLVLAIVAVGGYWGYVELKPTTTIETVVEEENNSIIVPDPDVVGGVGTEPTYSFIDSAE